VYVSPDFNSAVQAWRLYYRHSFDMLHQKSSSSQFRVDADKQHPRTVEKYRNITDVNPSYILLSRLLKVFLHISTNLNIVAVASEHRVQKK